MARDKNAIEYRRGDSYSRTVTVTDQGAPVDLTDCVALLTVSTAENPVDDTTEVFQLIGIIDDEPATGKVHFIPSTTDNGTAGIFFYDVEITDVAGNVRTPIKSTWTITQDITK